MSGYPFDNSEFGNFQNDLLNGPFGGTEQQITSFLPDLQSNFTQFHSGSSESLSSVVNSLPTSTQSWACPSYISDYYYDAYPIHQENPKYSMPTAPITFESPVRAMSGRNSAPPRILSEPPTFYEHPPIEVPPMAPRCSTPSLPVFDNCLPISMSKIENIPSSTSPRSSPMTSSSATLTESESQVIYKELCNPFTQRILCFFSSNGAVPLVCDICKSSTILEVCKGKNAQMACGHYVPCNECRGRTVRRLLRCVNCCLDLTSEFPVCGDSCVDVSAGKEPSNTGSCPRCNKKLRREVCGSACNRRKLERYIELRSQLNDKVAVLVLNPTDCLKCPQSGIWRPCSHFSYCASHNVICKGHGKDTTCYLCKGNKKLEKRRASLDLRPSKRRCLRGPE